MPSEAEISKLLSDHEKRIKKLEKLFEEVPPEKEKKKSIKEFVIEKDPANDVQRALAIGYYLEKFEKLKPFNASDLVDGFRRAKMTPPKNVNDKINLNKRKEHVMEDGRKDSKKAWCLTYKGEKFVESGFKE